MLDARRKVFRRLQPFWPGRIDVSWTGSFGPRPCRAKLQCSSWRPPPRCDSLPSEVTTWHKRGHKPRAVIHRFSRLCNLQSFVLNNASQLGSFKRRSVPNLRPGIQYFLRSTRPRGALFFSLPPDASSPSSQVPGYASTSGPSCPRCINQCLSACRCVCTRGCLSTFAEPLGYRPHLRGRESRDPLCTVSEPTMHPTAHLEEPRMMRPKLRV